MTTNKRSNGYIRRSLDAFIRSRERRAERLVSRTLLSFDDDTLKAAGYDRAELLRRAGNGTLL